MGTAAEIDALLREATARPQALGTAALARLLAEEDAGARAAITAAAYAVKCRIIGTRVSVRALVEAGNVCAKNCLYCGIRRANGKVGRYQLEADEIVRLAKAAAQAHFASLVIQSGEIESAAHTAFIEDVLRRLAPLDLGITLSLGEQTEDVYRRWRAAGATRYLLRIESSNPDLYRRIHPADHSWTRRAECLRALRRTGYQVGTGVMSALPGQTWDDLADDVAFFGEMDVDMIGMGPYIPHPDTPLGRENDPSMTDARRLELGLRMIAVTRLHLHNVNIAAATALEALAPDGRERGLLAGANVLMPNVTAIRYRDQYKLYTGKPDWDESPARTRQDLDRRLAALGESVLWDQRGDSPHFQTS